MQWENSDILVMKEVRVRSPYLSDCVFGGTDAANNRVKKVVSCHLRILCVVFNQKLNGVNIGHLYFILQC